jgi:hypothetical protein
MLIHSALLLDFSPVEGEGGGGGGAPATGGEGGGEDLRAVVQQTQHELAERTGRYEQEMGELRGKQSENQAFLERLRGAIAPETTQREPADPYQAQISEAEKQLDHYLQAAVDAERNGRPIPLTVNLAVHQFQSQIAAAKENQKLQKELRDLRAKADRATDPNAQIDTTAYSHMDTFVQNSLETIFGPEGQNDAQKTAQFKAITSQLADEIRDLKKEQPQTWDRIRRDPGKLKKMVNHFVEQNMPPKARQIIEQERLQREPMSVRELQTAFAQAASIEDPRERANVRAQIRQSILERTYGRGKGYNSVG